MITYNVLTASDIDLSMFAFFDRTQNVIKCWRKANGEWSIQEAPFIDNWDENNYRDGIRYLKTVLDAGGYVAAAFSDGQLKGFVSVEPVIFGTQAKYINLSNLHVSRDRRGQGIGRELFRLAKQWAKERQAEKLYISAHSAVESQAFYRAMGCVEAEEYNKCLADKSPCDCQMECAL